MEVVGLHHVGVCVSDLARSIAFYAEVFGLELVARLSFEGEELAFLAVGSARLELIESPPVGARPTGVTDHFALQVDDLAEFAARLRRHGVTMVDRAPVAVPQLGARILFCLGPDGERIELFELQREKDVGSVRAGAVNPVAVDFPVRPG